MSASIEYRSSPTREALHRGTTEWGANGLEGHQAYLDFVRQLGHYAGLYDTYFSCAITNGGYARDPSLSYGQRVAMNTDYSLRMADELAEYKQVDLTHSIDAVALGKVEGWEQSDYLVFFMNVMARPQILVDRGSFDRAHKKLLEPGDDFNADILNDAKLSHEERRPHYQALGKRYLAIADEFFTDPIDRMVELLDWDMTLGGLVERELAQSLQAEVYRPAVVQFGTLAPFDGVDPALQAHGKRLDELGAATTTTKNTTLKLIKL